MKVRYTVPSDASRVGYLTNGSTTVFSVPFVFFDDTDLQVILVNNTTAGETTLALTTNYTVTGGGGSTGSLTTVSTYASGYTLVIQREVPYTQEIDYSPNDGFPAEVNEKGLDRGVMQVQQALRRAKQSPQLPATYDPSGNAITIPLPVNGKVLAGKSDETGWENVAVGTLATSAIPILLGTTAVGQVLQTDGTNYKNVRVRFSAELFGIKGDNSTDNQTAIDSAIAAIAALTPYGGGELYFGPGYYQHSGAIVITTNGVCLTGSSPANTRLITTSATADQVVIGTTTLAPVGNFIRGIGFGSTVARSAGASLRFRYCQNGGAYDTAFYSPFRGMEFNAAYQVNATRARIETPTASTGQGIFLQGNRDGLGGGVRGSDVYLSYIEMAGPSSGTQPQAGVYIQDFSGVWMDKVGTVQMGNGLLMAPGASDIVEHLFTSRCSWDSGSDSGCLLQPGGGTIRRWGSVADWFASNSGRGITTAGTGTIADLRFTSPHILNNGLEGARWVKGTLTILSNVHMTTPFISGNSASSSGTYSGLVWTDTDRFHLHGGRIGQMNGYTDRHKYNAELTGTNTFFSLTDVDMDGGVTGPFVTADTLSASKMVRDCLGYVTEGSGTGTIASGSTSAVITHGLSRTPSLKDISIVFGEQGTNDYGRWSVGSFTSTQFTVTVQSDPGASGLDFAWQARLV